MRPLVFFPNFFLKNSLTFSFQNEPWSKVGRKKLVEMYNTSCARFLRRSAARRHDYDVPSIGKLFNCTLHNLFVKLLFLAGTKLKIKINL